MLHFPSPPLPPPPGAPPPVWERYRHLRAQYDKQERRFEAMVIVMLGVFSVMFVSGLTWVLYAEFGWRGPAWALLIAGLFAVAVREVEKRL